eukprot:GHVU01035508.1.p2 GENE.GHVU01035508.1~~GHVU01035508.1.p2  ORF type:complete len:128 (+),score=6.05 GHVU01035508.1:16-399(+)
MYVICMYVVSTVIRTYIHWMDERAAAPPSAKNVIMSARTYGPITSVGGVRKRVLQTTRARTHIHTPHRRSVFIRSPSSSLSQSPAGAAPAPPLRHEGPGPPLRHRQLQQRLRVRRMNLQRPVEVFFS